MWDFFFDENRANDHILQVKVKNIGRLDTKIAVKEQLFHAIYFFRTLRWANGSHVWLLREIKKVFQSAAGNAHEAVSEGKAGELIEERVIVVEASGLVVC